MTLPPQYEKISRPPWEEYFMQIAFLVAKRATCLRRQVGAVIVKDRHILTTGYNGPPKGFHHCDEHGGCPRLQANVESGKGHDACWALHAEQNAIIQAGYHGVSIRDSELYCTTQPCSICAKMIINAGITKVYYVGGYPDALSNELFAKTGVALVKLEWQGK
ncbi:MAG: dCMP deaminase family protein [bacterium]